MKSMIIIPSFISKKEASCPCGCGQMPENSFLNKINALRTLAGFPLAFHFSRCAEYNSLKGGAEDSAHPLGLAVDITCHDPIKKMRIVDLAVAIGFKCIEIADQHIHLDDKERGYDPILITGVSK